MKNDINTILYKAMYFGFVYFLIYSSLISFVMTYDYVKEFFIFRDHSVTNYLEIKNSIEQLFSFPVIATILCFLLALYRTVVLYPNFINSDWRIYQNNEEGIFITDLVVVTLLNSLAIIHTFSYIK